MAVIGSAANSIKEDPGFFSFDKGFYIFLITMTMHAYGNRCDAGRVTEIAEEG